MLAAATQRAPFRGIRRFDISRDLGAIADLIDEAFGDEPDQAGQSIASELRSLSHLGPLLWLLDRLSVSSSDWFSGFVWVERGRVVGNVTLSREGYAGSHWLISNVVVAEEYRRRGIARELMEASLDFLRSKRASIAYLMVRRDNEAALTLYDHLDFSTVGGVATYRRERPPEARLDEPPLKPGWTLRDSRYEDTKDLSRLLNAATPEPLLQLKSAQGVALAVEAEQAPLNWLLSKVGLQRSHRWVLQRDEEIVAYLRLEIRRSKYHRLRLVVRPAVRGEVEEALLTRALNRLVGAPTLPVLADVWSNEDGVQAVLERYGFDESRWLVVMMRRLNTAFRVED